MSKLSNLEKTRLALKTKRQNTDVTCHKGRYSYESRLVAQLCEAESIATMALDKLTEIARLYGFGDEYEKICAILERFNEYQLKAFNSTTKGVDWDETPIKRAPPKIEKLPLSEYIFGKTWDEIEEMQGGKIKID